MWLTFLWGAMVWYWDAPVKPVAFCSISRSRSHECAAGSGLARCAPGGGRFPADLRWQFSEELGLRSGLLASGGGLDRRRNQAGPPAEVSHVLHLERRHTGRFRAEAGI